MKRIIVLILCIGMLLTVACTAKEQPETAEQIPTQQTPQKPGEPEAEPTAAPQPTENSEPDEVAIVTPLPEQPTEAPVPEEQPTEAPTPEALITPEPETPAPSEVPATPYVPDLALLPQQYTVHDASVKEAEMFHFDIDYDGEEETISYRLDEEEDTTYIVIDGEELAFTESSMFDSAILIDLDPETPWVNLLVVIDWASDDYFTTEVHLADGVPVKGVQRELIVLNDDGTLLSVERTDLLGTKEGSRRLYGEDLRPDSEWLECRKLTKKDLTEDREICIELGVLLHSKRKITCTIDGKSSTLKKGTYMFVTRFHDSKRLVEVQTEDGQIALISVDYDPDEYTYTINGYPQNKVFDNLFYAD